mgnify:FL=1
MNNKLELYILGGGPAGVALSYYAHKNNIDFKLFEATSQIGGNCRTITYGDFKYDTGAHRLHDKDEKVTKLIMSVLKEDLLKVSAPSQIYLDSKKISFPLQLNNILNELSWNELKQIIFENTFNRIKPQKTFENFKDLAYKRYGKTLADLFLINYTEKLWGTSADFLNVRVSGDRLKNLKLSSLIKKNILGSKYKSKHLEGSFYYPKHGFGTIFESLKNGIEKNICLNSPIKKISHKNNFIKEIRIGDKKTIKVNQVISTLPLNYFIKILDPPPPEYILKIIKSFKFRSLRICVLFLNIKSFSKNASIYFPDKKLPFTRIYEPKNRSKYMAPRNKTCIVIEVPCNKKDQIYSINENKFFERIKSTLFDQDLLNPSDILDQSSIKIPYAYPILTSDIDDKISSAMKYLAAFKNLKILGRNAKFEYIHVHNLFFDSNTLINKYT